MVIKNETWNQQQRNAESEPLPCLENSHGKRQHHKAEALSENRSPQGYHHKHYQ